MEVEEIVEESLDFTCLPDHIWERIISFSKKFKNLMLTCKYFNDLISKSRKLMAMMTLVLDASRYNNEEHVSAILKSTRKFSSVSVEDVNVLGFNYYKILGHFTKYIREIEFDDSIKLSSILLVDVFGMMPNLEKLNFYEGSKLMDDYQKPVFEKDRILKKFEGSPSILPCMPKIEDLTCSEADGYCLVLKKYLESHNRLKKLEINFENHPEFPQISSVFKLETFKIFVNELPDDDSDDEDRSYLSRNVIDFIQTQAKSLKHLVIDGYVYNFDIIRELFDGLKELESVDLRGELGRQSNDHLAIEFQCPKVKKLILNVTRFDYPQFFKNFPNLEVLHFDMLASGYMVNSAEQNCRKIREMCIFDFNSAFRSATFPELLKLEIGQLNGGSESCLEAFLSRHENLLELIFNFEVEAETFWKLPMLLPNLKDIRFEAFEGFCEADLKTFLILGKNIEWITFFTLNRRVFDLKLVTDWLDRDRPLYIIQDDLYIDSDDDDVMSGGDD